MSDSASASRSLDRAIDEMDKRDCPSKDAKKKKHKWDEESFYGAKRCSLCKRVVYTK